MHLTHAIRRARMVSTNRRIRAYRLGLDNIATLYRGEARFSVVIVRGNWTAEIIKKSSTEKLLEVMGLKEWSATKP
jgi:hypothetical protein